MTPIETVRAAYGLRAAEYIDCLGSIEAATEGDRDQVRAWADTAEGRILDVGCGPGQWTRWLTDLGHDVEGVDLTPAFVEEARRRHPGLTFCVGRAENLDVASGTLGGVLAWYSLIHTEPDRIRAPLTEFARCLRPGGGLALGFCTGPRVEAFGHTVVTAYYWPVDVLAGIVEAAGFEVTATTTRKAPRARNQGFITACRLPRSHTPPQR